MVWEKGKKVSQGRRKASPTTFRVADEPRVPQVAERFFKTGNKKEEISVGFSKRLPPQSSQETQSDESGSASFGKKTQEHK